MLQKVGDFFKTGSVAAIALAVITGALLLAGKGAFERTSLPGGSAFAAEGAISSPYRAGQSLPLSTCPKKRIHF